MAEIDVEQQRQFAVAVVQQLRSTGFEAYWAGGCVRDQLLGRTPKDYDVATNATPPEIRDVFGRRRTLAIGAAFGVVTVLGPPGAGPIEVATFRRDDGYSDGRHPDTVTFTSAEEDALRRDFTVNGLFYDPVNEQVIDYVGGREDIERRVLRAIGDPKDRFTEDKLRMLRAVRLTSTLAFALDAPTVEAIQEMAGEISVVSAERIAAEVERMLSDPNRSTAVQLLRDTGLLAAILPAGLPLPDEPAWSHSIEVLNRLVTTSFAPALAVLLNAFTDHGMAPMVARHWRLSNADTERACWLIANWTALEDAEQRSWPVLQRILIHDGAAELLAIFDARVAAGQASAADAAFVHQRYAWPTQQLDPPPLITGDDLIQHGLRPGKQFKEYLDAARDAQLLGDLTTLDEALDFVRKLSGPDDGSGGSVE